MLIHQYSHPPLKIINERCEIEVYARCWKIKANYLESYPFEKTKVFSIRERSSK
ncbi:hypothetical protein MTR_2g025495 [Medicago truncatula]|uniref:Uncharacterized protein n=1 Tax=Medicago truncatula TaxID=3880 RepID=A0A072VFL8_MEDTR|nr:hypothetical protein MTR_2g025495 [Medicago truncatula]